MKSKLASVVTQDLQLALLKVINDDRLPTEVQLHAVDTECGYAVNASIKYGAIDAWFIQTWSLGAGAKATQVARRNSGLKLNRDVLFYEWEDKRLQQVLLREPRGDAV